MNNINSLPPFKRLCVTIGNLPSSYVDSMSYYECLMWLCNYLKNTVIPAVNENAEAVNELINWFNNLDVQDEINNKLDEMVESGELQQLLNLQYQALRNETNARYDELTSQTNDRYDELTTETNNKLSQQDLEIDELTSKVNGIVEQTPIPVSSVESMTDITKVYLNTTNGKWYYYDGDSWEIGGDYQSTGLSDGSVTPVKTSFATSVNQPIKGTTSRLEIDLTDVGYYVNPSNGHVSQTTEFGTYKVTDYIEINSKNVYYSIGLISGAFYDSEQTYISGFTKTDQQVVARNVLTIPANAKYVRANITGLFYNGTRAYYIDEVEYTNDYYTNITKLLLSDDSVKATQTDFVDQTTITTEGEYTYLPYTLSAEDTGLDLYNGNTKVQSTYKVTDYIEINSNDKFILQGVNAIVYYNRNHEYITYKNIPDAQVVNGYIPEVPDGAIYFRGNVTKLFWREGSTYVIRFTRIPLTYSYELKIPDLKITYDNLSEVNISGKFTDKNVVCLGDSITGSYLEAPRSYTALVNSLGHFENVYNCGFGGTQMSDHKSVYYRPFCFCELAEAIALNDYSSQEAQIGQTPDQPNYRENLTRLEGIDFSNIDYLTVFFGTNDYAQGVPYDNEENKYDKTTFAGALRYGLDKILTAYPNIKIVLIEPIYRWFNNNTDSDTRAIDNIYLTEYVKIINDVAEEFHLPVIHTYYGLNMNSYSKLVYFNAGDGTHPNDKGMKRIAEKFVDTFNNNY